MRIIPSLNPNEKSRFLFGRGFESQKTPSAWSLAFWTHFLGNVVSTRLAPPSVLSFGIPILCDSRSIQGTSRVQGKKTTGPSESSEVSCHKQQSLVEKALCCCWQPVRCLPFVSAELDPDGKAGPGQRNKTDAVVHDWRKGKVVQKANPARRTASSFKSSLSISEQFPSLPVA
jgi:hypothetical protein